MQRLNKKGFSLVELLVAMAIIAVLISIAAFGIQIVQRNARDTKRRQAVQDLQLNIADYQVTNTTYPPGPLGVNATTGVVFFNAVATSQTVKGFSVYAANNVANCVISAKETQQNRIQLCYDPTALKIGVSLEGSATGYTTDV